MLLKRYVCIDLSQYRAEQDFVAVKCCDRIGAPFFLYLNVTPGHDYTLFAPPSQPALLDDIIFRVRHYGHALTAYRGIQGRQHIRAGSSNMNILGLRLQHRVWVDRYESGKRYAINEGFWIPIAK